MTPSPSPSPSVVFLTLKGLQCNSFSLYCSPHVSYINYRFQIIKVAINVMERLILAPSEEGYNNNWYKVQNKHSSRLSSIIKCLSLRQILSTVMLAALMRLKADPTSLPHHPKTIIVGAETSREAFDPALSGVLHIYQKALTLDLHILSALHHTPDTRYIAVVTTAAELYTIVQQIPESDNLHQRFAIVAIATTLQESVALRVAALRHLHGVGVAIAANDGRAKGVFHNILKQWREGEPDTMTEQNVWGDANLTSATDVIIPPGWDSEGKIRAVVDAAGEDFDAVVNASSWGSVVPRPDIELLDAKVEEEQRVCAAETKAAFEIELEKWMQGLHSIAKSDNKEAALRDKNNNTTKASSQQPQQQASTQSDFFQKLLAGSR